MEIYGKHAIEAAIKHNKKIENIFLDLKKYSSIVFELKKRAIPFQDFSMYKGNAQNHQKIVANLVDDNFHVNVEYLMEKLLKEKSNPILVLVDQITDPQNLGSIIRNISAFEIDGLIIPNFNQSPITPTVIKTSVGTIFDVNISIVSSLNKTVTNLKNNGFKIVSTVMNGDKELSDISKLNEPLVIVLGSESEGISPLLLSKSDHLLKIKISNKVESLNVSSTAAIILHTLSKLR